MHERLRNIRVWDVHLVRLESTAAFRISQRGAASRVVGAKKSQRQVSSNHYTHIAAQRQNSYAILSARANGT